MDSAAVAGKTRPFMEVEDEEEEVDDDDDDYHGSTSARPSSSSSSSLQSRSIFTQDRDENQDADTNADVSEGSAPSCTEDVCYDANSDIYHIEMGNQSITEPRVLHIIVANSNPLPVRRRQTH